MKSLLHGALLSIVLSSTTSAAELSDGEVRKIDKAQARITLRHGEIRNIDMPPMTMVFRVRDPKWLDQLAPGDKVRFAAEKVDGQYVVTELAPLR